MLWSKSRSKEREFRRIGKKSKIHYNNPHSLLVNASYILCSFLFLILNDHIFFLLLFDIAIWEESDCDRFFSEDKALQCSLSFCYGS